MEILIDLDLGCGGLKVNIFLEGVVVGGLVGGWSFVNFVVDCGVGFGDIVNLDLDLDSDGSEWGLFKTGLDLDLKESGEELENCVFIVVVMEIGDIGDDWIGFRFVDGFVVV